MVMGLDAGGGITGRRFGVCLDRAEEMGAEGSGFSRPKEPDLDVPEGGGAGGWEVGLFLAFFEAALDTGNAKQVEFCVAVCRAHVTGETPRMARRARRKKQRREPTALEECLEAAGGLEYGERGALPGICYAAEAMARGGAEGPEEGKVFGRGYAGELVAPLEVNFGWACKALVYVRALREAGKGGWMEAREAALAVRGECVGARDVWRLIEDIAVEEDVTAGGVKEEEEMENEERPSKKLKAAEMAS